MIDFNKPVQTRDGRKVRILCTDGQDGRRPVVGFVEGSVQPATWPMNGIYASLCGESGTDLINVPERVERILIVDCIGGHLVQYKPDEMRSAWTHYPKIRITYEDGKPVAVALEDCK